jgi:hypothetical protein
MVKQERNDVAICMIGYSRVEKLFRTSYLKLNNVLAPSTAEPYPTSLRQIVSVVEHLLKTHEPESVCAK